jgi:hypothetical protein
MKQVVSICGTCSTEGLEVLTQPRFLLVGKVELFESADVVSSIAESPRGC